MKKHVPKPQKPKQKATNTLKRPKRAKTTLAPKVKSGDTGTKIGWAPVKTTLVRKKTRSNHVVFLRCGVKSTCALSCQTQSYANGAQKTEPQVERAFGQTLVPRQGSMPFFRSSGTTTHLFPAPLWWRLHHSPSAVAESTKESQHLEYMYSALV